MQKLNRISKYLSFILRHKPEAINLKLDEKGWADIDEIILNDYIVHYNLKEQEFFHVKKYYSNKYSSAASIPLYTLVDTFDFLTFTKRIEEEFDDITSNLYINRAKNLATSLLDYEMAFVNIHGGTIQDAVEIFSRINSKGSDMSPMWMISALTYEEGEVGFKFSDEVDNLKNNLLDFNFEDIKTEIILQCIESATGKIYFDVKTESLPQRNDFKELCLDTFDNIYKAADFLYNRLNVLKLRLLPYNLQLIFITEFFRLNKNPTEDKLEKLEQWFWQTTYSSYFSIYSLSKQRKAFKLFQEFSSNRNLEPLYKASKDEFVTAEFPTKIYYGSVRSKALALFLIKSVVDKYPGFKAKDLDDFYSLNKKDKDICLMFPKFKEIDYRPQFVEYKRNRNDFSFILHGNTLNFDYTANYIDKSFNDITDLDDLKEARYNLISEAESNFVKSLDIVYNFSSKYWYNPF